MLPLLTFRVLKKFKRIFIYSLVYFTIIRILLHNMTKAKINISYSKHENIIYVHREGEIFLNDIISFMKVIEKDFLKLERLFILDDARNSVTNHSIDELKPIHEFISSRSVDFKEIYATILVNEPNATAISIFFEEMSKSIENYSFKTFSSMNAAKIWLRSKM